LQEVEIQKEEEALGFAQEIFEWLHLGAQRFHRRLKRVAISVLLTT